MKTPLAIFDQINNNLLGGPRRQILFLLLLLINYSFGASAQTTKLWDQTLSTDGIDLRQKIIATPDGGLLVGGVFELGTGDHGREDYAVRKLNKAGNPVWSRTWGGYQGQEFLSALVATPDGGYLLGGSSSAGKGGAKSAVSKGGFDFWVVKISATGTKVWDKTFGGSANELLADLIATPDGGFLLGGTSASGISGDKSQASKGGNDYWVVKINAQGNQVWNKAFGGSSNDALAALVVAPNGGYLLGGTSTSGISGDKSQAGRGNSDYWVVKIDANGNPGWNKTFGGAGADTHSALLATADGGYLLGGLSDSGSSGEKSAASRGGTDFWVIKTTANGTKLWDKTLGGTQEEGSPFLGGYLTLAAAPNGGYLLAGASASGIGGDKTTASRGEFDYWLVRINNDGSKRWDQRYGGAVYDVLTDLAVTAEGDYVLAGFSESDLEDDKSEANQDYRDIWLVKVKEEVVSKQWDQTFGERSYGVPEQSSVDFLMPTPDGGYLLRYTNYITGEYPTTFITKVNQQGVKEWETGNYLGYCSLVRSLIPTAIVTVNGGYLLAGTKAKYIDEGEDDTVEDCVLSNLDFYVRKIDANGQTLWEKTYGGLGDEEIAQIVATPDGGFLLGGSSNSGSSGDKSQASRGGTDYWVVKLDGNGRKLWDKTLGGRRDERVENILVTADGGYLVGGYSNSGIGGDKTEASRGGVDYWLVKLAGNGTKLWNKTIGTRADEDGYYANYALHLMAAADGEFFLEGSSAAGISGDKTEESRGSTDYWVVKLSGSGQKLWDKTIGGSEEDKLGKVVATADGGALLAGATYSGISGNKTEASRGGSDYWAVKLDGNGRKSWDKTFGGKGNDGGGDSADGNFGYALQVEAVATSDGNYLLGGPSASGSSGDRREASQGEEDYWLVKMSAAGHKLWDKRYGGTQSDRLTELVSLANGRYLLAGSSQSMAIGGDKTEENNGGQEQEYGEVIWVVKIKEELPLPLTAAWNFRFGGSQTDRLPQTIATTDGGYLTAGSSLSPISGDKTQAGQGDYDIWVVKTNAQGAKLWDKRFGGLARESLNRILPTQDGGYLLGGSSASGISGDKTQSNRGGTDFWLVKISGTGVKQWDKRFGGSGFDYLNQVVQLPSGEYVVAGVSDSPADGDQTQINQGGYDVWVLKLTSAGAKIWDKRFGGTQREYVEGLVALPEGGYLVAGSSASGVSGNKTQSSQGGYDYWAVKLTSNGTKVWDKRFGGSADDRLTSLIRTSDGNYLLGGTSASGISGNKTQTTQGGIDYWTVKITGNGTKLWDKRFGGSAEDQLAAMLPTPDGGYLFAGSSPSGVSGDKTQASWGSSDYWVVKTDGNGVKQWDQRFGGAGADELRTVSATLDGGYLLGGQSASNIGGDKTQSSRGEIDYWLVKVMPTNGVSGVAVAGTKPSVLAVAQSPLEERTIPQEVSVSLAAYPNPFTARITARFAFPQSQMVTVKVYDSQGREVATLYQGEAQANKAYEVEWQPQANQPAGSYIIRLQPAAGKATYQRVLLTR